MKKIMTLMLVCALALNLAACGSKSSSSETSSASAVASSEASSEEISEAESDSEEVSEESSEEVSEALHLSVTTEVYENEYTSDDGTVLINEKFEIPLLQICTESGEVYTGNAADASLVSVQEAFNSKMEEVLASFQADSATYYETADSTYADMPDQFADGMAWANELTVTDIYQSNDGLLSVSALGYSNYGGAHPNSFTRSWNFDLTTGEFITLDYLENDTAHFSGETLSTIIALNISNTVYKENLYENYFDDYADVINDFENEATMSFTSDGLLVTFDTYLLASYAEGSQSFTVPYNVFYNYLNDHGKELLSVSDEEKVLADYNDAATLWRWFNMTTPPITETKATDDENSYVYYADITGVSTLDDMKQLTYRYFTTDYADKLFEDTGRFSEVNGKLCASVGARGGDITISYDDRSVTINGSSGTLIQTVYYQDVNSNNEWELTGESATYQYPFTFSDGQTRFSDFPYPY